MARWLRQNLHWLVGTICAVAALIYGDRVLWHLFGGRLSCKAITVTDPISHLQSPTIPKFNLSPWVNPELAESAIIMVLILSGIAIWKSQMLDRLDGGKYFGKLRLLPKLIGAAMIITVVVIIGFGNYQNFQNPTLPQWSTTALKQLIDLRIGQAEKYSKLDLRPLRTASYDALDGKSFSVAPGWELGSELDRVRAFEPTIAFASWNEQIEFKKTMALLNTVAAAMQQKKCLVAEATFDGEKSFKAGSSVGATVTLYATNEVPRIDSYVLETNEIYLAKLGLIAPSFLPISGIAVETPLPFSQARHAVWDCVFAPSEKSLGPQRVTAVVLVKKQTNTNDYVPGPTVKIDMFITDDTGLPPWVTKWLLPAFIFVLGAIVVEIIKRIFGQKEESKPEPQKTIPRPVAVKPTRSDNPDNPS